MRAARPAGPAVKHHAHAKNLFVCTESSSFSIASERFCHGGWRPWRPFAAGRAVASAGPYSPAPPAAGSDAVSAIGSRRSWNGPRAIRTTSKGVRSSRRTPIRPKPSGRSRTAPSTSPTWVTAARSPTRSPSRSSGQRQRVRLRRVRQRSNRRFDVLRKAGLRRRLGRWHRPGIA